jgi:hypothetical protein
MSAAAERTKWAAVLSGAVLIVTFLFLLGQAQAENRMRTARAKEAGA